MNVSNTTVYKNSIATPAKPKAPGTTALAPLLLITTEWEEAEDETGTTVETELPDLTVVRAVVAAEDPGAPLFSVVVAEDPGASLFSMVHGQSVMVKVVGAVAV